MRLERPLVGNTVAIVGALSLATVFLIGTLSWPYGFDGYHWFLTQYQSSVTISAWGFLWSNLVSLLGWPYSRNVWTFLTVAIITASAYLVGNKRWYLVVLSAPAIWNIWLGQVEVIHVAGAVLAYLVVTKRLPVAFLGLATAFLADKPQVGSLVIILAWYLAWKQYRWKVIESVAVFVCYTLATMLIFTDWIPNWIKTLLVFNSNLSGQQWNSSIFPYGLLALPFAVFPSKDTRSWFQRVLAVTSLASPYFILYHAVTLMVFEKSIWVLLLSWGLVILSVVTGSSALGWLLPVVILIREFARRGQ